MKRAGKAKAVFLALAHNVSTIFTVSDPSFLAGQEAPIPKQKGTDRWPWIISFLVLLVLWSVIVSPTHGPTLARQNVAMQNARSIGILMSQYARDHDGKYPEGKSSTEVFQKLIDGKYCSNLEVFYLPLPGRTKGVEGEPLKPENVGWDITVSSDSRISDGLPLVFLTGYKITYAPGGSAIRLPKPLPKYSFKPRTWSQWWRGEQPLSSWMDGIAVCYQGNNARFIRLTSESVDGSILNFIPANFNPAGKTYRQLTPDGPLP